MSEDAIDGRTDVTEDERRAHWTPQDHADQSAMDQWVAERKAMHQTLRDAALCLLARERVAAFILPLSDGKVVCAGTPQQIVELLTKEIT